MISKYSGDVKEIKRPRVIFFQPALPSYRIDFFDRVERRLGENLIVYYSVSDMGALSARSDEPSWARQLASMLKLPGGLEWQSGVLSTSLKRDDLIVVSGAPRNISNMMILAWARLRGIRTIWWGHYWSSTSKHHRFLLRILLMNLANAILFYTDQEVAEYRRSYGKKNRRPVKALNNGINVDPIRLLREPYDAAQRDNALLFIGRLTEKAELSLVLNALSDPRLQHVCLNVIGDGPERATLQNLAQELEVERQVVWHGGTTDEPTIARIANSCKLFVYPGAVGLSLLHAMAYGLPVVVHDDRWTHMPEIAAFYRAKCGTTFTLGKSESLTNAILRALESSSAENLWSAAAVHVSENEFSTEHMADRFFDLLQHLQTDVERDDS